jgi:hypothetical protein
MPSWLQLNDLGNIATLAVAFLLVRRYRAAPRSAHLPPYGYVGAAIVFVGQFLTQIGVTPVAIYFTAIAWTGYILWVDAAIYALRGRSLLHNSPREFLWLALCSIPLWLLFEGYNLRLANWIYVGLPYNLVARYFGYVWAFATIWPAIFETATLLRALGWKTSPPSPERPPAAPPEPSRRAVRVSAVVGALLVTVPLLLPQPLASYSFGAVWLGFIFLMESINVRTGRPSLWRDLLHGDSGRLASLLWAGLICGLLWEFWNYRAAARWVYTVPILPQYRVFAMPLAGYLGFPPFAVECFVLFAFVAPYLSRLTRKPPSATADWEALRL